MNTLIKRILITSIEVVAIYNVIGKIADWREYKKDIKMEEMKAKEKISQN